MKIIFFTMAFTRGGAERVISTLSEEYIRNGNEVYLITCLSTPPEYSLNPNIKYMTLNQNTKEDSRNKLFQFFIRRRRIKKIINEVQPDIIISFLPEPNMIITSLKSVIKTPIIISERNSPKHKYKNWLVSKIVKYLYPKANGFVFQTEEARNYFGNDSKLIQNSTIIPNPVNPVFCKNKFNGLREKSIVTVGRLESQKNHMLLISAFRDVLKIHHDFQLIIYGEGSLRNHLETKIKEYGLEGYVKLPGVKENIEDEIFKASMFVLPSDYEGMPNALMEAMALGLPVISTDAPAGGSRELIEDKVNGFLIPVGSKRKLVEKMLYIIEQPADSEMMANNASNVADEYNINKISELWESYIQKFI